MITSRETYMLVCALLTGLLAAYWIVVDVIRLRAALREDGGDAIVRDRRFGASLGIVIGLIGVFGVLKYYYF